MLALIKASQQLTLALYTVAGEFIFEDYLPPPIITPETIESQSVGDDADDEDSFDSDAQRGSPGVPHYTSMAIDVLEDSSDDDWDEINDSEVSDANDARAGS